MISKNHIFPFTIIFLSLVTIVAASTVIDYQQSDFDSGTYFQTEWNSSGFVWLAPSNTSGNFTSQIFNAGSISQWNNISWFTEVPYNQELPDNQAVETGDFLRGANMTGNVLLLHFNNDSAYGENDTHVYDFSGNGNNGTITSAIWNSSGGKLYGGYTFDGSDDYVDCGNDLSLMFNESDDDFTYGAWIYSKNPEAGSWQGIIYHGAAGESQGHLGINPTGYLSSGTGDGSTWQTHQTTYLISQNTWIYVTMALDRNTDVMKIYANGNEVGNYSHNFVPTATSVSLRIGEGNPNSERFDGLIDEVAIWNRSLSETEILDVYKRGATRLNLTVQNCSSEDCSDGTWQDINDTSAQDLNLTSQYFQYKYEFETDNVSYSPELYNVSLDYTLLADPVVNISLVYPTTNISVYKNRFFNFTVNVSCSEADCGEINVSLDPVVNWWNSSFDKRKEINITNVGSTTLTDFPAYLNITYNENMQTDFDDLRFINGSCEDDSSLELAYEIENYTSVKADIWIKIPSLATGVNSICMYYNNSGASSGENVTGVWDDNFKMVQHMQETSGTHYDSTIYGNNGAQSGGVMQDAIGKIDGADDFDGGDDFVNCIADDTTDFVSDHENFTVGAWIKSDCDAEADWRRIVFRTEQSGNTYGWQIYQHNLKFGGDIRDNSVSIEKEASSSASLNDSNWHYVMMNGIYDGSWTMKLYVDGVENTETHSGTGWGSSAGVDILYIGKRHDDTWWDGIIDEVRISNVTRSADWINQSYQMIANPTTYVSSGAEEDYSAAGKGLISTVAGATPFYTNKSSNPFNITLNAGESQLVTFWVNATGEYDSSYDFFAYVNVTSNLSISAITETLNLTIISNPLLISNSVQSPESPTNYVGQYQFNITVSDYDSDYDTVLFSWNSGENQTVTTYENVSGGREYYYDLETAITGASIPFTWFANDSQGNTDTSSGTYAITSIQTSASLSLDKIISLQELNSTDIIYNITLRTTNKGGSRADNVNLIDSDSSSSPYDLGDIVAGNRSSVSYLKIYSRNSSTYNTTLSIATVNGTDHLELGEISANSSQAVLVIPATTANTTLTVLKNAEYLSENLTDVNYNLTVTVVNSGGSDLTSITIQDSDISLDTSVNLNRTQTYSISGTKTISKTSSNAEHIFSKANATYDAVTYESNELKVLIPGYGNAGNLFLVKSASLLETTNTNVSYNISLRLTNNGGRNLTSVEINDSDSSSSPYSIGTLISGQEILRSYTKTFDRTTYATNQTLVSVSANGTDAISGLIETTAEGIVLAIPGTQTPASFVLDKIATIHNVTNTTINYNITLRLTNKGGSDATSSNITDSDSNDSPYDLGTVSANSSIERSYIENFTRQDTTIYQLLSTATTQGIDSYSSSLISANSTEINVTIPDTEIGKQIVITKNVVYSSENSTAVTYNVSSTLYNSGDEDLISINYIDTDLNDAAFTIDISKGDSYLISKLVTLDKAASNTDHEFDLGMATIDGLNFYSNRPTIRIPGYGGPADTYVYSPESVTTSTSFDTIIRVKNLNNDVGQNFIIGYWITNDAETINYSSGQSTVYVAALGETDTTVTLTSPSSSGIYRLRALVSYAGGPDIAYDTFLVTASSTPETPSGGSPGGGGGSITGRATEEVVCNAPYIRYEKGCCLDSNNNSICDKDEILKSPEEENKTSDVGEIEESPTKTQTFLSNTLNKIKQFFKTSFRYVKQNNLYFIIGFGSLIFILLSVIVIIKISKSKTKHKLIGGLETKLQHLKSLKRKGRIGKLAYHTEREELLQKINKVLKNKHFILILGAIGLIALFSIMSKPSITGGVVGVGEAVKINWWSVFGILVILVLIGILIILFYVLKELKSIKSRLNENTEKEKEHKEDKYLKKIAINNKKYVIKSISELINKKVYTDSGHYIGNIREMILEKNRIDSLKIKLDKKQKFKIKGIIIKYNNVKSVGDIVLVDEEILNKINFLKD